MLYHFKGFSINRIDCGDSFIFEVCTSSFHKIACYNKTDVLSIYTTKKNKKNFFLFLTGFISEEDFFNSLK